MLFNADLCVLTTRLKTKVIYVSAAFGKATRETQAGNNVCPRTKMRSWLCKSLMDALQGWLCHWFLGWAMAQRRQSHLPLVLLTPDSMGNTCRNTHTASSFPSFLPLNWAFHTRIKPQLETIISAHPRKTNRSSNNMVIRDEILWKMPLNWRLKDTMQFK